MATLGEFLRNTRISKNLTLGQVKKATHIREHVLISIENDELDVFHSTAQLRGFIKHYAEFLGLDPVALIQEYLNLPTTETSSPQQTTVEENSTNRTTIEQPDLIDVDAPETISQKSSIATSDHITIYQAIGQTLGQRRQLLNLSIDEVEYYSHLRRRTVELLEKGDFDAFASPVQVKGLLATYADFLDLDREQIMTEFAEGLMARRRFISNLGPDEEIPSPIFANAAQPFTLPLWVRSIASVDLVFGFSVLLILGAITLWGAYTVINTSQAVPTSSSSLSVALLANATSEGTPPSELGLTATVEPNTEGNLPQEGTSTPEVLPTTEQSKAINITLVISDMLFLRVSVDGQTVITTRTNPGDVLDFHGNKSIEILTGNGAGVDVVFNGENVGAMGEQGSGVLQIYNSSGSITPTPTISPTPTATGRPTRTPIPTATSRASATPAP